MKKFISAIDDLPYIVKLIFCIPCLDVIWSIYKLFKSLNKENPLGIVLAILTIVPGAFFIWIIDLLTLLFTGKVWWVD